MRLCLWLSAALLVGSVQASIIDSGSISQGAYPGGLCINISSTEANFSLSGHIGSTNDALCFACPLGAFDAIFVTTITDASFGTGSLTSTVSPIQISASTTIPRLNLSASWYWR